MSESAKPKSRKAKAGKTKSANLPQAPLQAEDHEEIPLKEQPAPSTFRANTRLGAVYSGIRAHWQFTLTFIVACVGTWLLVNQNDLLDTQNVLLGSQNALMTNQNTLIQHQMSLEEADRRGALVMLMSNIMDKVDKEIELQQAGLSKQARDKTRFNLSPSLIGQIVALSHSFKPYRYLEEDSLINEQLSPERGQLLITLTLLPLDTSCFNKIYKSSTFQQADLNNAVLREVYLSGADLNGADLHGADLSGTDLRGADLSGTDLRGADLSGTDLRGADLRRANLSGALFILANLHKADLNSANLSRVYLSGADLSEADLSEADLSEAYLKELDLRKLDLSEHDLRKFDLRNLDLREHNLRMADWDRFHSKLASLIGTFLGDANLSGADLSGADLKSVNFSVRQASESLSLYECNGINDSIKAILLKSHPQLFEEPKGMEHLKFHMLRRRHVPIR